MADALPREASIGADVSASVEVEGEDGERRASSNCVVGARRCKPPHTNNVSCPSRRTTAAVW